MRKLESICGRLVLGCAAMALGAFAFFATLEPSGHGERTPAPQTKAVRTPGGREASATRVPSTTDRADPVRRAAPPASRAAFPAIEPQPTGRSPADAPNRPWRAEDAREVAAEIAAAGPRDLAIYELTSGSFESAADTGGGRLPPDADPTADNLDALPGPARGEPILIDGEVVSDFSTWYPGKNAIDSGALPAGTLPAPPGPFWIPEADIAD